MPGQKQKPGGLQLSSAYRIPFTSPVSGDCLTPSSTPASFIPSRIRPGRCMSEISIPSSGLKDPISCSRSPSLNLDATGHAGSHSRRYGKRTLRDGESTGSGLRSSRAGRGRKDPGHGSRQSRESDLDLPEIVSCQVKLQWCSHPSWFSIGTWQTDGGTNRHYTMPN